MKKVTFWMLFTIVVLAETASLQAQQSEEKQSDVLTEDEEGPLMLKFEPNFMTSVEMQREDIKKKARYHRHLEYFGSQTASTLARTLQKRNF